MQYLKPSRSQQTRELDFHLGAPGRTILASQGGNKTMLKAIFLLSLFVLLNSDDCDPHKQADKIRALEADVKQLKTDVAETKQRAKAEHHYELRNVGFRMFRFDPVTGDTCIQLTSEADWKLKDTKRQSCNCADEADHWREMPKDTDQHKSAAQGYYDWVVKSACGI
jgi:hypothetical protein